jgi:heme exporter protein D
MQGQIQGGWGFIWAAYGITWTALVLYGASLWHRYRSLR